MAALLKCTSIVGGLTVLEADPAILDFSDVIYVPFNDPASQPGLYDHGQKLVLQSWYFRGSNPLARCGGLGTPYEYRSLRAVAPEPLYIYCGWMHVHFGHFLLSTLSRFWSRPWEQHPDAKILVHVQDDLDWWFGRTWFVTLVTAMGLSRDRFVSFGQATAIRRVIVCAPAFEEENFAYRAFARFSNALGRQLAGDRIGMPDNRPVFLSKARMTTGVQRLENEAEITAVLERNGVEIVFPELLSLQEQAALWHNRPFVASFANSALHASLLAPGRTIIGVSYGLNIQSSYTLVDQANNTNASYLRPVDGVLTNTGEKDGFSTNHVAHDPVGIAEDLLRALDFQQRTAASRAGESVARRHGYWSFGGAGPLPPDPDGRLRNLAIDKPVRQSSTAPWETLQSPNANTGTLTGLYQFHTDLEQDPWWEIDLLQPCLIQQIRLFNRLDNSGERCGRFTLSIRAAEQDPFEIVHLQDQPELFGGLDGTPFCWVAAEPVSARIVRITLLGREYFHLDQVEILGVPGYPAPRREPNARSGPMPAGDDTTGPDATKRRASWLSSLLGGRSGG